jgi:hypothetical protein
MTQIVESIRQPNKKLQQAIYNDIDAAQETLEEKTFDECLPGWTFDQLVSCIAPTDGQPSKLPLAAKPNVDG